MSDTALDGGSAGAVLLSLVGEDDAVRLVDTLGPGEVRHLCGAMETLGSVGEIEVERVLGDFIARAKKVNSVANEGERQVRTAIERALGPRRARTVLKAAGGVEDHPLFDRLRWLDAGQIAVLIGREHPQVAAVILSRVEPVIAARAVATLDEADRVQLLLRVATADPVATTALDDLLALLEQSEAARTEVLVDLGGTATVAAILNHSDRTRADRDQKALARFDKVLAARIDELRVVFDDVVALTDRDLASVVRAADPATLVRALSGLDEAQRDRFLSGMSARAAQTMRDDIDELGDVRPADVEEAQTALAAFARRMADEGSIRIGTAASDV